MTREEFDSKFKNDFHNSPLLQHIRNANDKYAGFIIDVAAFIESKYDRLSAYEEKPYTPHDFQHHIINVIKNANSLLEGKFTCFEVEDLFCFMLACILHDIGMIYFADENRFYHSYVAADMISDLFSPASASKEYREIIDLANLNKPKIEDPQKKIDSLKIAINSQLNNEEFMTAAVRRKVAVMILGHSDLKFEKPTKTKLNTLKSDLYKSVRGITVPPSIQNLAAFLRWADELDLSSQRFGNIDSSNVPKKSKPFWEKLQLVESVIISPGETSLNINGDEYFANKKKARTHLKEILKKLDDERVTCNELFRANGQHKFVFPEITSKSIYPEDPIRLDFEMDYTPPAREPSNETNNSETQKPFIEPNEQLDPEMLEKAIRACIEDRHFCKEGHCCLHKKDPKNGIKADFCIRNPIDCNGLLSRHDLLDDIAQLLLSYIPKDQEGNLMDYVLIGIANSGALIGAHMSALSGLPFAPWVPNNKGVQYTPQEKDLQYIKDKYPSRKVALVIGINYTGTAIKDACDKIGNVDCVVGLLNRDLQEKEGTKKMLKEKSLHSAFLIEDYPIEICQYSTKKKCPYNKICSMHTYDQE